MTTYGLRERIEQIEQWAREAGLEQTVRPGDGGSPVVLMSALAHFTELVERAALARASDYVRARWVRDSKELSKGSMSKKESDTAQRIADTIADMASDEMRWSSERWRLRTAADANAGMPSYSAATAESYSAAPVDNYSAAIAENYSAATTAQPVAWMLPKKGNEGIPR
jgi:hypothetical protein